MPADPSTTADTEKGDIPLFRCCCIVGGVAASHEKEECPLFRAEECYLEVRNVGKSYGRGARRTDGTTTRIPSR